MKIFKYCLVYALAFAASRSEAIPIIVTNYTISGALTSYSLTIPGMPTLTSALDPDEVKISGYLLAGYAADLSYFEIPKANFNEAYHDVDFSDLGKGLNATKIFPHESLGFTSYDASYDPLSRTLTASLSWGSGNRSSSAFCIGAVAICSELYYLESAPGTLEVVLTFDSTLMSFTGVAVRTGTLVNGSSFSSRYEFFSTSSEITQVPLPAAGWLLGSGLLGLAGGAIRRARASAGVA